MVAEKKNTMVAAAVFALQRSVTLDTQQNGWNTAGSLQDHLASKIVCIQISSILRQKKMGTGRTALQCPLFFAVCFMFKTLVQADFFHTILYFIRFYLTPLTPVTPLQANR